MKLNRIHRSNRTVKQRMNRATRYTNKERTNASGFNKQQVAEAKDDTGFGYWVSEATHQG
jgi:hypothetical protein